MGEGDGGGKSVLRYDGGLSVRGKENWGSKHLQVIKMTR